MHENGNQPLSVETMAYLNENLSKMRIKINEFFDRLEFTNDAEGKKVAVITAGDIQRMFEELNELRQ
jgi:hypothetical protein